MGLVEEPGEENLHHMFPAESCQGRAARIVASRRTELKFRDVERRLTLALRASSVRWYRMTSKGGR